MELMSINEYFFQRDVKRFGEIAANSMKSASLAMTALSETFKNKIKVAADLEMEMAKGEILKGEMKVLKLTLKKKWFDMIKSGEKKEEYREIKDYWENRLFTKTKINPNHLTEREYDVIQFFNGAYFSEKLPNFLIESKGIRCGTGLEKWGAEKDHHYFILKLGKLL